MLRSTFVCLVLLGLSATLEAAPTRTRDAKQSAPRVEKKATTETANVTNDGIPDQFIFTATSEVLLDGQPCRYDDVPSDATITNLHLARDLKTIIRIQFKSK